MMTNSLGRAMCKTAAEIRALVNGSMLRRLRTEARLTQVEVASRTGMPLSRVSELECGHKYIGLRGLILWADACRVNVHYDGHAIMFTRR
jgi:transcriptional regulator with XRE-family HTH domain